MRMRILGDGPGVGPDTVRVVEVSRTVNFKSCGAFPDYNPELRT